MVQQLVAEASDSRTGLAKSAQFEEIVLDDDEEDDDKQASSTAATTAATAKRDAPSPASGTYNLPSMANLLLGATFPPVLSGVTGVPAPPPPMPQVPLPPTPSGLRASAAAAAAQAVGRGAKSAQSSPRPATPPAPSAHHSERAGQHSGQQHQPSASTPMHQGSPYAQATGFKPPGSTTAPPLALTPEQAYAAQVTAAHIAHLNPQLWAHILQQSLYPAAATAAASTSGQAPAGGQQPMLFSPYLPPNAQYRPLPTSGDARQPTLPPMPPSAAQSSASAPRTQPPQRQPQQQFHHHQQHPHQYQQQQHQQPNHTLAPPRTWPSSHQ
jgi:hypothetical protein